MKQTTLALVMGLLTLGTLRIAGQDSGIEIDYVLLPSPETVSWGYYDATTPPALRIESGETVELHTLAVGSPAGLEALGVAPDEVEPEMRDIHENVARGGVHILTGPIYVEGAEPGDVLEVRIHEVRTRTPYGINTMSGRGGFLPGEFEGGTTMLIRFDEERGVGLFGPGIEVPLRPFLGSMGVAPAAEEGRVSSVAPWNFAGNMDNKELIGGTTLYIPVHVPGALFQAGDGHAAQGNGEVDVTGIETSLISTLQFFVRKDMSLDWPEAETPTHYITMGFDEDLVEATKLALRNAIDYLAREKGMNRSDAFQLSSVAVDLAITQLVDGNVGVHAMIPKELFVD